MTSSDIAHQPRLDLQRISHTILELHRAGRESAYQQFQPRALDILGEIIPFDSAWWGNAAAEPLEIHRLHLHNCDNSILETYTPYMDQDFFRAALMAAPGVTINMADLITRARFVRTELYRMVGKRYKIEWSLGTLLLEPVSSLQEFLTLWRHDPKKSFTETERQTKELLMPHLADAHRASRLREVLDDPRERRDCWAVTDERGFLREANPGFVHCLRKHWPDWKGNRLPEGIVKCISSCSPCQIGVLKLSITPKQPFYFLRVEAPGAVDELSPREHDIATRYAQGKTHAAIALELGLSPATVRNHIARCFRKLSVNNKAELIMRLSHAR